MARDVERWSGVVKRSSRQLPKRRTRWVCGQIFVRQCVCPVSGKLPRRSNIPDPHSWNFDLGNVEQGQHKDQPVVGKDLRDAALLHHDIELLFGASFLLLVSSRCKFFPNPIHFSSERHD